MTKDSDKIKLKIMTITRSLNFGGLERVVIDICKNLDKNKFDPIVVCLNKKGEFADELEADNIPVISLNPSGSHASKYINWLKLRKLIKIEKPDIIHSHNTGPFIDGIIASRLTKLKGFIHTDHARRFPDKKKYMVYERIASHFADKIIAVSEETKDNLVKYENIKRDKIAVIYNGIDAKKFDIQIDKDSFIKELKLEKFDRLIGLGVVLTDQKGITYLLRATQEIVKKFPKVGVVIAGDGPERKKLEAEASNLKISDNVVFLGSRKDIQNILKILDLYILPSEWEGFPLVILEAMAAHSSIITTDVGGIPIAIDDGIEGILIKPRDPALIAEKTIALLEDDALREKIAQNAYSKYMENFTVQKMVKNYEEAYFEIMGLN